MLVRSAPTTPDFDVHPPHGRQRALGARNAAAISAATSTGARARRQPLPRRGRRGVAWHSRRRRGVHVGRQPHVDLELVVLRRPQRTDAACRLQEHKLLDKHLWIFEKKLPK